MEIIEKIERQLSPEEQERVGGYLAQARINRDFRNYLQENPRANPTEVVDMFMTSDIQSQLEDTRAKQTVEAIRDYSERQLATNKFHIEATEGEREGTPGFHLYSLFSQYDGAVDFITEGEIEFSISDGILIITTDRETLEKIYGMLSFNKKPDAGAFSVNAHSRDYRFSDETRQLGSFVVVEKGESQEIIRHELCHAVNTTRNVEYRQAGNIHQDEYIEKEEVMSGRAEPDDSLNIWLRIYGLEINNKYPSHIKEYIKEKERAISRNEMRMIPVLDERIERKRKEEAIYRDKLLSMIVDSSEIMALNHELGMDILASTPIEDWYLFTDKLKVLDELGGRSPADVRATLDGQYSKIPEEQQIESDIPL